MAAEDKITDREIETLALQWPWPLEQTAVALRLAERESWPLDDTVRALDVLAEDYGNESDPVQVIRAAIDYKRRERARRPRYEA